LPDPFSGQSPEPTDQERTWAMIAHLSPILVGFIGPLVLMLAGDSFVGRPSKFVAHAAKQSLIFCIVVIVGGILTCGVGVIVGIIFQIIAGIDASKGSWYVYPGLSSFADPR
jgi:uncharacterized Tic20 family protein